MVEQPILNKIFRSLADPTRRDILSRVYRQEHSISELAEKYKMSFAAIAKHVNVLERAKLVHKRKDGKQQIISIESSSFELANQYLQNYADLWNESFDRLEVMLEMENNERQ